MPASQVGQHPRLMGQHHQNIQYWDAIRTRQAEDDYRDQKSKEEGLKKGREEGLEIEMQQGMQKGKLIGVETTLNVIQALKENQLNEVEIALKFELTPDMVTQIKNRI